MKENRVPDGESEKIRKIEFPKGKSERRRKIRFPMGERERNRKRFRVLLNNARTTTRGGVLGGHQQHRHGKGETATHGARSTSQNGWDQVMQTQKFGKAVPCVENRMKKRPNKQTHPDHYLQHIWARQRDPRTSEDTTSMASSEAPEGFR